MLDAQNAVAAPAAVRREDYRPPDWLVPEISLDFELDAERTVVRSALKVEPAPTAEGRPLRLNGDGIEPASVKVDGGEAEWRLDGGDLVLDLPAGVHEIEIVTEIHPRANTKLMGLYESGGHLCTQCEAEGFRRITFFPDRPDVLSRYRVKMSADKAALSGAARQRRSGRLGRARGRPPLGGVARSLPEALLSVRLGRGRPCRPIATASPPPRAERSRSASG